MASAWLGKPKLVASAISPAFQVNYVNYAVMHLVLTAVSRGGARDLTACVQPASSQRQYLIQCNHFLGYCQCLQDDLLLISWCLKYGHYFIAYFNCITAFKAL